MHLENPVSLLMQDICDVTLLVKKTMNDEKQNGAYLKDLSIPLENNLKLELCELLDNRRTFKGL